MKTQVSRRRALAALGGSLTGLLFVPGCVLQIGSSSPRTPDPPFSFKATKDWKPIYCFDTVGHTSGSKPFILGGTCCCTPTQELMDKYHADGLLADMQLKDLLALYAKKGIHTALDHKGCNNLCQWGPHVVKGGHCMVPPTPATHNFEEVRFGFKRVLLQRRS